jgi:hypothetical protein
MTRAADPSLNDKTKFWTYDMQATVRETNNIYLLYEEKILL